LRDVPRLYTYSMELERKLALLADAAKYDASCNSSGAPKRHAAPGRGIGSTTGMGICHSFTPDGRCVSLLKILLTNFCVYDCLYCVNRRSSDVPRARFAVSKVVDLTLSFCRRNYIEGLFLSSGIIRSAVLRSQDDRRDTIAVALTADLRFAATMAEGANI
jgi:predicted DNA-binding helix-hairpin-helix protein